MKLAAILAVMLMVTACAPLFQQHVKSSPESLWQLRHQALIKLEHWQLQGRTVIRQGKEAFNAGLRWQQHRNSYQIKLEGPFSQGGITLNGDDKQAVLALADGKELLASDAEVLIKQSLGIPLPISALRNWIRGIPDASINIDTLELNAKGQITHLVQQDWDISYLRYVPFGIYSMPDKIFINKQDMSLRLIITRWKDVP
jgi:outer membrane lipoprotein LolB